MPGMRYFRARSNARASREGQARYLGDLRERERIELRHDLAQEPRAIMACRFEASPPLAIATMLLGIGGAALASSPIASARVVAFGGLDCERLSSDFDRSQAAFPARLGECTHRNADACA